MGCHRDAPWGATASVTVESIGEPSTLKPRWCLTSLGGGVACGTGGRDGPQTCAWHMIRRVAEFVERCGEADRDRWSGGEVVLAATEILHERMARR